MNTDLFNGFYSGKRVLVSGHTGFKGSWLSIWLHSLGAEVIGVSLDPYSERDNFVLSGIGNKMTDLRADINDGKKLKEIFQMYSPQIVFHLAAQPIVRESYKIPVETWQTNVMGTINVMEAIRSLRGKVSAVMITTDKCYENKEQAIGYKEGDPMGGYDPYSSSKGGAEIAISSWRRSFFNPDSYSSHNKSIASARAGNVIGGGDWATDRIIPDCIRAIEAGIPVAIRSPKAIRPWQHVLEPLYGYMLLAEAMWNYPGNYCSAWNFGPENESVATVMEVAEKLIGSYGKGSVEDVSAPGALHEANILMLDITKAKSRLGWSPRWNLDKCVKATAEWYKCYREENVYDLCIRQIEAYIK